MPKVARSCLPDNADQWTIVPPGLMTTFGFRKENRLLTSKDYDLVFKQANYRINAREFLMLAMENDANVSRVGTVVSKRVAGNAVERNRIRRLIKETFRLAVNTGAVNTGADTPASGIGTGVDIVVVARPPVRDQPNPDVIQSLQMLWQKLARKRAQ